jgi:hypothetical protein
MCVFKEKEVKKKRIEWWKNDRLERPNCVTQTRNKKIHDKKHAYVCTEQ